MVIEFLVGLSVILALFGPLWYAWHRLVLGPRGPAPLPEMQWSREFVKYQRVLGESIAGAQPSFARLIIAYPTAVRSPRVEKIVARARGEADYPALSAGFEEAIRKVVLEEVGALNKQMSALRQAIDRLGDEVLAHPVSPGGLRGAYAAPETLQ